MAHLTLPIGPDGPMLMIVIGVSDARRVALEAAGQTVPPYATVRALVDTGASCTSVDPSVIAPLNLTPTGLAQVFTPTTGSIPKTVPMYDVMVGFSAATNKAPAVFPTVAVLESELLPQGFHALIGRDLLADCVLVYNGAMQQFTLAF